MAKKEDRFVKIYSHGGGFSKPATWILVDKQTGVNYLYAQSGYAGGLTPLLNRDGTPIVTTVPNKYEE